MLFTATFMLSTGTKGIMPLKLYEWVKLMSSNKLITQV